MFRMDVSDEIFLRMLSGRDSTPLFEITDRSRLYLKNWLPWLDSIKSEEDSLEFIKGSLEAYQRRNALTAGIFYQNNLVGVIGYNTLDFRNKIGTIGYWLAEDMQGKGIVTQSVNALVIYGFSSLLLNRIEIRVASENLVSQKVPQRLNFTYEGKLRESELLYDRFVDHHVYSLLKSEWQL